MGQKSCEIVVLKPTAVFLAYLASQLPAGKLPDLRSLQIDNTAYTLPKSNSDEETLNQIEKYYSKMFRHEIRRWLGEQAAKAMTTNFLDFLCCFKFELHNHIILMEPSVAEANQLLLFQPQKPLLDWLRDSVEGEDDLVEVMDQVKLANLQENATVMVKNFSNLMDIHPFIRKFYYSIFATLMTRITNQSAQWPKVNSFQEFRKYFFIEIHTQLIHLH